MTSITERFILRVAAPAKRDARVFANQLSARSYNPHMTSDVQWTVEPRIDRCFLRLWFLWTTIQPLEVQCPSWAGHDHLGDLIRRGCIDLDPRSFLRLEDFRQTAKAIAGVNAQFRFP